jgi:hypothetical protein
VAAALAASAAQSAAPMQVRLDPAVIDRLASADDAVRATAKEEVRRAGRSAWEPLRRFALSSPEPGRGAATKLLHELLDTAATELLQGIPERLQTRPDARPDWKLSVSSDLFPFLRSYKYYDRYPRTALFDLEAGKQIAPIDAKAMNALIPRFVPNGPSLEQRQEAAAFFVSLSEEPYSAANVVARARREGAGFVVAVTFEKTEVWAPPTRPEIAGSRTCEYETTLRMDQRGLLEVVARKQLKVLLHTP